MEIEKISIKVLSHIKVENHIEYLINISDKTSGNNIFFSEKYQNLRSLYEQMKKESKQKKLPSFPPNKLFGYEEESFVIQRAKDLNSFFQQIISNKIFSKIPSFTNFISFNLQRNPLNQSNENKMEMSNNNNSSDVIIVNKNQNKSHNKRFKIRAMLFNNSFYKGDKNISNLDKKEIDNICKKFVNLNYDIEVKNKPKSEKEYKNFFDDIDFNDNFDCNIIKNNNDNNFDIIGKNNDYIKIAEKNNNSYMKKNLEKFKAMTNIIEPENLLLK